MMARRERGFTLLEVVVALAVLGLILVAAAQVSERVLSRSRLEPARADGRELELSLVPVLREDLRRGRVSFGFPPWFDPATDRLVLERSGGTYDRLAVWGVEPGVITRRELRRVSPWKWRETRVREWRGAFQAAIRFAPPWPWPPRRVELVVTDATPEHAGLVSFTYALRR